MLQNRNKKIYLTKEGLEKLEQELKDLTTNKRKEVALRIKEAKEFGDLSENSEYEEAKNEQAFIEGRIAEAQNILKNSVLISNKGTSGKISVGSKVTVEIAGELTEFIIVGSTEADPMQGKISNESPIGQALLNRKEGEEVEIEVPAGKLIYKVKKIH
ncbi:transcription elongation factor GreA [bacterium CG_4_10_14_0_2_um_filter_33_32]|nr:MAG: transcription elongation factor GreA [bacterium CG2_30_33_46]PIR67208.1 MAG: transcription elongation factor GreA [bacterium CG10_big_fil_rev_8_21_14_0_10_33_18]PIU76538.1 MAG: transcription elongation factor GreA [bacterium CG06_land_8_20_14_3_00_33_50]PIW81223.1 MAG: transcription elongation factor GreA [bacterium CG_4_8_14_3_um_filter_33_28]PIY85618.1 MAG: transcription elongation factor GreA [bacterium CG_4_10_14_0_8_um_filter_33_57]PIZ86032.1 MAG: transcription elongation factor G